MLATLEVKLIGAVVMLALLAAYGLGAYEYGKSVVHKADAIAVATKIGRNQAADQKNKEDANVSENDLIASVNAVHAYYRTHPVVRVLDVPGSCSGAETADNSKVADGAAASQYASPYPPDQTELVAVRLNELQKRLIAASKDGRVVFK